MVEVQLNRPLQQIICLLHMVELPAKHLMGNLDGGTCGPVATRGPIGDVLRSFNLTPFVNFKKINTKVPNMDKSL